MKYRVSSTIDVGYGIELLPGILHGMTEEEYLKSFSSTFHSVENMDDIVEYIIESIPVEDYIPYMFIEGVGYIGDKFDISNGKSDIVAVVSMEWYSRNSDITKVGV